ncbi:hypothetical protein TRAPUB_12464 [Trametes pubescens]|uniref:DUF6535 domain-containing protein n=1 Tax=Trametes pubescens TaxID=154538 RepID=A0A1M2VU16_TRAPU|nr:hypothetical protein TRAPUB_12464 [Trametes pubescens]
MSEHHGSEPLSVGELSQPPTAYDPVSSERELPAGAGLYETKEVSEEGKAKRPRPEIPNAVSLEDMYFKRDKVYTQTEKTEAWSSAAKMVETYSDEMIKRWKEEIDTYLVFAGLFSAVLTTFNVQSYLLLQPAAPDPTIAVLQQIFTQLASFSIHPPFVNSTQPPGATSANTNTPPPVPRWAVWLNALWFSGLILSLSSASVGIMVKQWLNEYSSGVSGTSRPIARVRQYRLQNLRTWRVEDIIGTIPILLQLALALFLAGILILLWTLHDTVAAIASTLVGLLAVFTAVTTLLPLINHECSYLTPQIRAVNAVWQPKRFVYRVCSSVSAWCHTASECLGSIHSAASMIRSLGSAIKRPEAWNEHKQTWQGRERAAIDDRTHELDKQTLLEAYRTTLSQDALSAASVCLMDFSSSDVVDYFQQLYKSAREHFGAAADSEDGPLGYGNPQQLLWLHMILCILLDGELALSDGEADALRVYFQHGSWSSGMQAADAEWALSTCNAISDHFETTGTSSAVRIIDRDQLLLRKTSLIYHAMHREKALTNVLLRDVTWAYRQVRLKQSRLTEADSDDAKAAHTTYLQSANYSLWCAHRALTSSLPANDRETVRAYTQDVLAELTSTLLGLFAEDNVRKTIDSLDIYLVMSTLSHLDDARVEECVPDDLVPDILNLVEKLETASDYVDNYWVPRIEEHARTFKAKLVRVKNTQSTTTSPETPPAGPSGTRAVEEEIPASPQPTSAVDPQDGLQDARTANPGDASS